MPMPISKEQKTKRERGNVQCFPVPAVRCCHARLAGRVLLMLRYRLLPVFQKKNCLRQGGAFVWQVH